jgi:hypothetical protein
VIVFVTAYDSATRANQAVARRILQDNELFLDGESASKQELMLALERHDGPLFAMTHGESDRLFAHGHDDAPPALCTADIAEARLAARSVFAHACKAARDLGHAVARAGSVFWGYMVAVNAPEDAPELLPIFAEVFSFIKMSFSEALSDDAQDGFFRELYERCESAQARLSKLHEAGEVEVPFSAEYCLFQLQQDLVVWSPGKDEARSAPWARARRQLEL